MRQAAATEQSNITERFTRAIDQLGKLNEGDYTPHRVIRLGGIYALERIVEDAKNMHIQSGERYHDQVIDVLAAYVRESAPYDPAKKQVLAESPSEDVQAALTVIGRLGNVKDREIDLSRTNLKKVNLSNATIHNVSFEQSLLDGANLHGAVMRWGWFEKASLRKAFLDEADLSHGQFTDAALDGARMHLTDMQHAGLSVTLRKSVLDFTDLRGAFIASDVSETTFDGTDLRGADLRQCGGLSILKLASTVIDDTTKLPRSLRHVPMEGWRKLREISAQARVEVLERMSRQFEEAWEREPESERDTADDA
jgi:uncharacterized protein YjbI with pentapeptide repeats